MIGLDSNILIRLATGESPSQYDACRRLLRDQLSPARPGDVSMVAMVELSWTLRRIYKFPWDRVLEFIDGLLVDAHLVFERQDLVGKAYGRCKREVMDFSDALISAVHAEDGCERTLTLDQGFAATGLADLLQTAH